MVDAQMNANELANKLMSSLTMEYDCDEYMEQAATMLRQQQAEIEALKKQVVIWEKEAMNARIKMSLYRVEIKNLRKAQEK
jgi:hypothetical protein